MKLNTRTTIAVSALSCALASGASLAATSNTTFQVTATVASSCSVSAGALAFGTYDPLAVTDKSGTSTINVTCNLLSPYTLKLNGGAVNATILDRQMSDGGTNTLDYQLYTSALLSAVWGDGVDGSTVTGLGTGLSIPHTVHGVITNGQNVPNGSYADTVTVSLDF